MRKYDPDDLLGKAYDPRIARRLVACAKPYKKQVLFAAGAIIAATAMELLLPVLFSRVATVVSSGHGSVRTLNELGLAAILALVVRSFANWGQLYYTSWLGHYVVFDLRAGLFRRLQWLSIGYVENRGVGSLMTRIQNDAGAINDFFEDGAATILSRMLVLVGIVVIMFIDNWRLAILAYLVLPFMVYGMVFWRRRALTSYRETRRAISAVNVDLAEGIAGIRVTQSFTQEPARFQQFTKLNRNNLDTLLRASRQTAISLPLVQVASAAATALVLAGSGKLAFGVHTSIGDLVLFIGLIDRFFDPIRDLSQQFTALQATVAAGERIFEMLDLEPDVQDRPDAYQLPPITGKVDLRDVHFGYGTVDVLKGIDLAAAPGQTIALVGETGAGKSSIINLMMRFYDVWSGSVEYDGHDVRNVTQRSLREQVSIVPQDSFLFAGSIRDNIRFGRPEATDEEIELAAQRVGAHAFIERMPEGYDSMAMERGTALSAGQRQLLAFARALLADRKILILDEATSSVDAETELQIQRAVSELLKGRTSFVIAHRLSTIRTADEVVVLRAGRIIERGTHNALMLAGGYYARLQEAQWRGEAPIAR
jgi:ABC-type multidrug transport system fused ATPase/permease subunit